MRQSHHHDQRLKQHLRELYLHQLLPYQFQPQQPALHAHAPDYLHFSNHELTELNPQLSKYRGAVVVKLIQRQELSNEPWQSMGKPCCPAIVHLHQV